VLKADNFFSAEDNIGGSKTETDGGKQIREIKLRNLTQGAGTQQNQKENKKSFFAGFFISSIS
tara:strand:- start:790 stop:978 length:189 start_codon:yes stop_codon:yes gene_type:complete